MKRILFFFALSCVSLTLAAQTDRATLTGSITDSSGAAIPTAEVTVTAVATDTVRTVKASGAGGYSIASLPVGAYRLSVIAAGFQTENVQPFELEVGQTRNLDIHLAVSGVESSVDVTAIAALEQTSVAVGGVIVPEQIQNLPVNGRNWTNLMALVPGAMDTGTGDQKSIRFAGRGQDDNNYRFDGVDATGGQNQGQRTSARLQISTDAIAEFRASSALYGAESGGTDGGQVEIVTRSGTNRLHGSAFDFFRNDHFDARTFDNNGLPKPAFRMQQFGGSVGGPVLHDRTFFFLNFEAIHQRLGQTLLGLVPSASYRATAAAMSPPVVPILNAYPVGQKPYQGSADVAASTSTGKQLLTENSGLIRVDHHFTDKTSAFVRFNLDRLVGDIPFGASGFFLQDRLGTVLNPYNAIIDVQHIFSPTVLNDFKIGFNRSDFHTANETVLPYAITVPQFTTLNNSIQKVAVSNTYGFIDNASFLLGRHAMKAGVEVRRVQINQSATASPDLTVAFASSGDLQKNVVSTVVLNATVPLTGLRKTEEFGYVLDEYKLRSNMTLTAGVRYEFYSNFNEAKGRGVVFDPRTCPTGGFCSAGSDFYFPYLLDIEPRLALSWSPLISGGRTVITTGYGTYYGDGQLGDLNAPVNNIAARESLSGKGLTYPVDAELAAGLSTSLAPRGLYRHRANQQVQAWSAAVQQGLTNTTVMQLQYLGTKGTHLFTRTYVNGINPATGTRPIPTLGLIDYKDTDSNSIFQALEATVKRDFHNGLFLAANYQWSHSINDGATGGGESLAAQNVNCRACERASSDQDIRSYFTASTVYELPIGRGKTYLNHNGVINGFLGGWQVSAIGTARTGSALNILLTRKTGDLPDGNNTNQRPDLVAGASQYPTHQTRQNWLNPAAYAVPKAGAWGNLGRNSARGPGLWQLDPALTKRTAITERLVLVFRAEAFNVFNRQQIGNPALNISSVASFGTIPTTVNIGATGSGTPRQLQFMLRAEF